MKRLKAFLDRDNSKLVATIVADIQRHVSVLGSSGISFYGYAALPGDYRTQPNPASLVVAFNREADIEEENSNDPYYRYSVDEWQNYVHEGFENTNSILQSELTQFRKLQISDDESYDEDDYEVVFFDNVNYAVLEALKILKENGTFGEGTFLLIWFSDSEYEIMNESAKALNKTEVYNQFIAEFQ